jgi:hypothetical protein
MFGTLCSDFDEMWYKMYSPTQNSLRLCELCKIRNKGSRTLLRGVKEYVLPVLPYLSSDF